LALVAALLPATPDPVGECNSVKAPAPAVVLVFPSQPSQTRRRA